MGLLAGVVTFVAGVVQKFCDIVSARRNALQVKHPWPIRQVVICLRFHKCPCVNHALPESLRCTDRKSLAESGLSTC